METISLTIPLAADALTRASDFLHGLALDAGRDPTDVNDQPAATVTPVAIAPLAAAVAPAVGLPTAEIIDHDPMTLDNAGMRWDERIHVESKAQLKKTGTWRLKKKVDPALVEKVKAEQTNQVGFELKVGANKVVAEPMTIQTPPAVIAAAVAPVAVAPVAVAPVAVAPVAVAPVAVAPVDFAGLMTKITQRQTEKPEFGATITAVLAEFNVASLPALIPMIDTIPAIDARLDELWLG